MADGSGPALLEMRGISKSFFGVRVLDGVDLELRAGEVHAVLGENGAGKSTLMKILCGAYEADEGQILLDGEVVAFRHPQEAQQRGLSIIYQEFNLLPERSVAQNIFVGREPMRGPVVDRRAMEERTRELLRRLKAEGVISPRSLVKHLPIAQQQTVEIAKALSYDARILVMDEPTAALAPHETEALFEQVRLLQAHGMGILFISHRLREIFALAQRVTVLKDGRRVGTVSVGDTTIGDLVRMMVGRELDHYFPPRATTGEVGEPRLAVHGGAVGILHDINLEVRVGEIVGIAGLAGSGRTELAQALFGIRPFVLGTVIVDGRRRRVVTPRQAIRRTIGLVSEDRKAEGLVLQLPVRDNALLALRGLGHWLRDRLPGKPMPMRELAARVDLRAAGLDQEVRYLSGGNQQKVVLAKWLATRSGILIFDEPTRGIDVGAKAAIHDLIRELARAGAAVLMISSELPEVIGMSDRVLVMRNGTIAGELPANPSEGEIMLLATGEHDVKVA